MAYELDEQKKVGVGLIGFGLVFTFLGVILFLDRGLLALGNILCLSGVALILGMKSSWQLLSKRMNVKGSVSFLAGILLIFVGWPIVGIILESYGSIVLFSGFWPSIKVFLCHIPVLGWFIQYPSLWHRTAKIWIGYHTWPCGRPLMGFLVAFDNPMHLEI